MRRLSMRGSAPLGILLILVGLLAVPLFKEVVGRLLLYFIFVGAGLFLVVFVVGGVVLIALRGAA
jgi:hypothetical protein